METHFANDQISAARIREALVDVAKAIRGADCLKQLGFFGSTTFADWVNLQVNDLEMHSEPLRKIQAQGEISSGPAKSSRAQISSEIEVLLTDLSGRVDRLGHLKRDAIRLVQMLGIGEKEMRGKQDCIKSLIPRQHDKAFLAGMNEFANSMTFQATEIVNLTASLEVVLKPEYAQRLIMATQAGKRPIRTALTAECQKFRSLIEEASDNQGVAADAVQEVGAQPGYSRTSKQAPSPLQVAQDESGVNPQIQLRRKELGNPLSDGEVARRTEVYFMQLWGLEVDQAKCAEILFFEPTASRGISIHDLLGLSNTDAILDQSKTQLMARFTRRG